MSGLHIRAGALDTVLDLDSTPTLHIRERTHFHFGEVLLLPKSQERRGLGCMVKAAATSYNLSDTCSTLRKCIAQMTEEGKVHLGGDTGWWCNPNTPSCLFSLILGGSRLLLTWGYTDTLGSIHKWRKGCKISLLQAVQEKSWGHLVQ